MCVSACVCVGGCGKGQRWIYNAKRLIVCALHSWKSNIITKKRTKMRNVTAIFHFQCWVFLGQDSFFSPGLDSRVLMYLCVFSKSEIKNLWLKSRMMRWRGGRERQKVHRLYTKRSHSDWTCWFILFSACSCVLLLHHSMSQSFLSLDLGCITYLIVLLCNVAQSFHA